MMDWKPISTLHTAGNVGSVLVGEWEGDGDKMTLFRVENVDPKPWKNGEHINNMDGSSIDIHKFATHWCHIEAPHRQKT